MIDDNANQKLKEYLNAQLEEIYIYKWCLGIEMCKDPLDEYTLNDICIMWINNNASSFRTKWLNEHGAGWFNGINN